jgi:hypothetical protein
MVMETGYKSMTKKLAMSARLDNKSKPEGGAKVR